MSLTDLVFKRVSDEEVIYDPETLTPSVSVDIRVINFGDEDLTDLGFFIEPATSVGDVDNPGDFSPETDYQDLLTWGTDSFLAIEASGGLKISAPQNDLSTLTTYFRRLDGDSPIRKISCADIPAGTSLEFTLELETPPSVSARRVYVDVVLK